MLIIFLMSLFVYAPKTQAITINASSCSATSIQNAINLAIDGDVVVVPAGTCFYAPPWEAFNLGFKAITVKGAGAGQTIISSAESQVVAYISGGPGRITGFTFDGGMISVYGQDWRIDHNAFTGPNFDEGIDASKGGPVWLDIRGLIDHNSFFRRRIVAYEYPGANISELDGSTQWSTLSAIGTAENVFIEDNTFEQGIHAIDGQFGGSYVFRHNTLLNTYIENHSASGQSRAGRSWEIYDNTITQTNVTTPYIFFIRGGTGVIYNNTVTGTFSGGFALDNRRSFEPGQTGWGSLCNGTNPWDGNADASGWPCLDQIGRGKDAQVFDGTPPPYPNQSSEPAYFWNNTLNSTNLAAGVTNSVYTTIASSPAPTMTSARLNSITFDGSRTIPAGAPVALPVSGGVVYRQILSVNGNDITFAATSSAPTVGGQVRAGSAVHIVDGRDYFNNTVRPGYTAYPYPHPLASSTPIPPPGPIVGDINLDHIVNSIDYSILNSDWFTANSRSDLNHDGLVNAIDYSLLNANWFKTW